MTPRTTVKAACLLATVLALAVAAKAAAQTPYYAPPAGIYTYGYAPYPYGAYSPRRAYRQALRYGYPPLFQSWPPRAPGDIYGYPYYGAMYRPLYMQPAERQIPTLAWPPPYPPGPSASTAEPPLTPEPAPESIPAPPSEPGPR